MSQLAHRAFLYGSQSEFVRTVEPFVRQGLERHEHVLVAVRRACGDALRGELGGDAGHVELRDTEEWCPRAGERLFALREMADAVPEGRALRAVGEPVWGGSPAVVREWAGFEAAVNVVLANAPMQFVCAYDREALPAEVLDHGRRAHPELLVDGAGLPCDTFVPPEELVPGLRQERVETAGAAPSELQFDAGEYSDLREWVASAARAHGMDDRLADDLVLAANEVATNAVMHGLPPVRARCWAAEGELVCEIADAGSGIDDPLAGWRLPGPAALHGWGLAMAHRLCDAVEIQATERGTVVLLHMTLR